MAENLFVLAVVVGGSAAGLFFLLSGISDGLVRRRIVIRASSREATGTSAVILGIMQILIGGFITGGIWFGVFRDLLASS